MGELSRRAKDGRDANACWKAITTAVSSCHLPACLTARLCVVFPSLSPLARLSPQTKRFFLGRCQVSSTLYLLLWSVGDAFRARG